MRRLIFQVSVGQPSNLYTLCQESVAKYCKKHDITHHIQTEPVLKILPNPKTTNRSEGAIRLGYLPIYEKEHAFTFFDRFDQIAIVDSDIYIRDNAPNIFDSLDIHADFGGVIEREMPITQEYARKIYHYSQSQYQSLDTNHRPNNFGWLDSPIQPNFFEVLIMTTEKKKSSLKRDEVVALVLDRLSSQGVDDVTTLATFKRLNLKGLLHFLEVTK